MEGTSVKKVDFQRNRTVIGGGISRREVRMGKVPNLNQLQRIGKLGPSRGGAGEVMMANY